MQLSTKLTRMFSPEGPSLRELAVQALSSVEHGYDLLAPKFDHTPFRTPDSVLDAVASALGRTGPFDGGLDLCCGTGAGVGVLARVCRESVTGVDFSAGMLDVARERRTAARGRAISWVRGDARALPFGPGTFDLVVSFGAFGHFLPARTARPVRPGPLRAAAGRQLRLPRRSPRHGPRPARYWMLLGFDAVMRVRNALWRPPFVMYYRAFRLGDVRRDLECAGFRVGLQALPEFGRRPDGSPRVRMVLAVRS